MRAIKTVRVQLAVLAAAAAFLGSAVHHSFQPDIAVLASSMGTGALDLARAVPDFVLRPDGDHPLLSPPRYRLTVAPPTAPLPPAGNRAPPAISLGIVPVPLPEHLLATPPQSVVPANIPALRTEGVGVPFLGEATIVGARLQFAHGPGSRFELRVDRPAAAFKMRF